MFSFSLTILIFFAVIIFVKKIKAKINRNVSISNWKKTWEKFEDRYNKEPITKIWLDESINECVRCGASEAICPKVFTCHEKMEVIQDVNPSEHSIKILEAIKNCPVDTIAVELSNSGQRDNPSYYHF